MKLESGEKRVLALDVGTVRVGLALSDPLGMTAQPGPTLQRQPEHEFYEKLGEFIESHDVSLVVLGLPIGLKGQKGSSFREVQRVLEEIRVRWPAIGVDTFDERFSSTMARQVTQAIPKKRKQKKGLVDQIAAQLILQGYLESKNFS